MLSVLNIYKSFGSLEVLKDVSLRVEAAEIVAVTGPSGAGKTTLLQIMGTLDHADRGAVKFDGRDVSSLSDSELSRFRNKEIGFVFQSHQLLPEFTLCENVMLPALIGGCSRKEAQTSALRFLDEVGLSSRATHKPSELSGGECQRGAVARALINSPRIILADEPTGNLDSGNTEELRNLFFQLRARHSTSFVIVTHDASLASRCDRIIRIADGKIVDA